MHLVNGHLTQPNSWESQCFERILRDVSEKLQSYLMALDEKSRDRQRDYCNVCAKMGPNARHTQRQAGKGPKSEV